MNRVFILSTALLCALPSAAQAVPNAAGQSSPVAPTQQVSQQQADIEKMQAKLADWAQLDRYRAEDAALPPPASGEQRVVFYGDSITDAWGHGADFFPGRPYVNRGISGQTTPQMLVRFQQDVVHLKPTVVVVLGGTNDIAGNTGPETPEMIEDNFLSMAAIAKQSGIRLVIASILPAFAYPWKPSLHPAEEIRSLNEWLKDFCGRNGDVYLDYYNAMADERGGMRPGLSKDGVHPTPQGYAIMSPLAEKAIAEALQKPEPVNKQ